MLREAGEIDELSRGVYRRADAEPTAHLDLLAVCARAPHAVVCGESALSLHELIDDIPHEVHIAVPRGSHRPSVSYPPTKVSQYAADTFDFAVERFEAAPGETVPVYSAARAVVDAMRLGRAEGRSLALSALNRYLRRAGQQGVADLQRRRANSAGCPPSARPSKRCSPDARPRPRHDRRPYIQRPAQPRPPHRRTHRPGHARVPARTLPLPRQHPPARPAALRPERRTPARPVRRPPHHPRHRHPRPGIPGRRARDHPPHHPDRRHRRRRRRRLRTRHAHHRAHPPRRRVPRPAPGHERHPQPRAPETATRRQLRRPRHPRPDSSNTPSTSPTRPSPSTATPSPPSSPRSSPPPSPSATSTPATATTPTSTSSSPATTSTATNSPPHWTTPPATAASRLRPLSEAISDLATRRQAPYTAWRRRQGHAAENHPTPSPTSSPPSPRSPTPW